MNHRKARYTKRALVIQHADFHLESGGYGWTRTTDPGIMSAVL